MTQKLPEKPLISFCGICCSMCPLYTAEQCPGCPELEECMFAQCAQSKGLRYCFFCDEFPCTLFEEGFEWDLDQTPEFKKYKLGTIKFKPHSNEYVKIFRIMKQKRLE